MEETSHTKDSSEEENKRAEIIESFEMKFFNAIKEAKEKIDSEDLKAKILKVEDKLIELGIFSSGQIKKIKSIQDKKQLDEFVLIMAGEFFGSYQLYSNK